MNARQMCAALALVAIVGCGADTPEVSDAARDELEPRVAEIRRLADARQPENAEIKLDELRVLVDDLTGRGALSAERATELRTALDAVAAQLDLITTTTTAPPEVDHDDEDEDEGSGKGKGRGRDDED